MHIPEPGPNVPRRGGAIRAAVGRFTLWLLGWRIEGTLPDVPKMLVIGAPHSSNWDFVIGIAAVFALRLDIRFLGKAELFRWPLGGLMRWFGGTPVDRSSPEGVVEETISHIKASPGFLLSMAPEGTRKPVDRWKTGFYRIALAAGIPIVAGYFDNARKRIGFGPVFHATGNTDAEIATMQKFYAGIARRR
jgi:1-acyl-sn-glycerol-3-phosphate acyltransferase